MVFELSTAVHDIFDHFIEIEIGIQRRSKHQLVAIRIEDGQLAYVLGLVQRAGDDIGTIGFGLLR